MILHEFPPSLRSPWRLRAAAAALGVLAPIVAGELALRLIPFSYDGRRRTPVNEQQPIARSQPDREFTWSRDWNFSIVNTVRINNAGFHSDVDYEADAPGPLLAVVGDSFVEAAMVPYRRTCAGRLATMLEPAARVYAFGQSDAGLGQYLAWARHARDAYRPSGLVFVIVWNDYLESLVEFGRRAGTHQFVDRGDGLSLERSDFDPTLAYRLARRSTLVRYLMHNLGLPYWSARVRLRFAGGRPARPKYHYRGERALASAKRAVDAFFELLPEYSGLGRERIVFVVDGMRPALYDDETLEAARGSDFDVMRRYFLANADRRGYETLDLQPRFIAHYRKHRQRFEWPQDIHWNAPGHERCFDAVRSSKLLSAAFPRP